MFCLGDIYQTLSLASLETRERSSQGAKLVEVIEPSQLFIYTHIHTYTDDEYGRYALVALALARVEAACTKVPPSARDRRQILPPSAELLGATPHILRPKDDDRAEMGSIARRHMRFATTTRRRDD
jgi:hypothetical protein